MVILLSVQETLADAGPFSWGSLTWNLLVVLTQGLTPRSPVSEHRVKPVFWLHVHLGLDLQACETILSLSFVQASAGEAPPGPPKDL